MIVNDVRLKKKTVTRGNQHDEGTHDYYDVQISVFNRWWSVSDEPDYLMDFQKALGLRDLINDTIKGRS